MTANNTCFHCELELVPGSVFEEKIEGKTRQFCCLGCKSVAHVITESGFTDYYRYRTESGERPDHEGSPVEGLFDFYDKTDVQSGFVAIHEDVASTTLQIDGIHCAACCWLIEHHLESLEGVDSAQVNLARRLLTVRWRPSSLLLSRIFQAIQEIGYHAVPWTPDAEESRLKAENRAALMRLGVAGIGMMQVGMYAIALHAGALQGMSELSRDFLRLSSLLIATLVVFYAARPFFINALRGVQNRAPGMDLPVALAIGIGYVASLYATYTGSGDVYFDSIVMFTFFLLSSRYLEARSRLRLSGQGNRMPLPEKAWKLKDGQVEAVLASQLVRGDDIWIKPGERIPVDGTVLEGSSEIDESILTGEFTPVSRSVDSRVLAGSLNGDGSLRVRVEQPIQESRLNQIDAMIRVVQTNRLPAAQAADRLAKWFVSAVLGSAVLVFVSWLLIDPDRALWVTLAVLVVSCPCALSLATPTALTAGLGVFKQNGVLVRNSHIIEEVDSLDTVIFDKTGTLTTGQMTIVHRHAIRGEENTNSDIATALEAYSNHPIAQAFRSENSRLVADHVQVISGAGVEGTVLGAQYRIGKPVYALRGENRFQKTVGDAIAESLKQHRARNGSDLPEFAQHVVLATADGEPLQLIFVADAVRANARRHIDRIATIVGRILMVTGDESGAAKSVATELGIDTVYQGIGPEQKLEILKAEQAAGRKVLAVGDGVNDGPLLSAANLSIAVSSATELSKYAADVVMINDSLDRIPLLLDIGKRVKRKVRQNLCWALGYNVTALPLAAAGLIPPYLAALGMSLSSLIVVVNALGIYRHDPLDEQQD